MGEQAAEAAGDRTADDLKRRGVELVAVTWVCNGGVARVKIVPVERLARAASTGVGASTTFSVFTGTDMIASAHGLDTPTGDLRVVPDLAAIATDGTPWAWAPGDLRDQEGAPWPTCPRELLRRQTAAAAGIGLELRLAFESEWTAYRLDGRTLHDGPAYGLDAARAAGEVLLAVVRGLRAVDVPVEQVHPEYSPGQLEVSIGPASPVAAADRIVLARDVIRTACRRLDLRASLSPKPDPGGLGNGAHLHFASGGTARTCSAAASTRATAWSRLPPPSSPGCWRSWTPWSRSVARGRCRSCAWDRASGRARTAAGAWRTGRPRCG